MKSGSRGINHLKIYKILTFKMLRSIFVKVSIKGWIRNRKKTTGSATLALNEKPPNLHKCTVQYFQNYTQCSSPTPERPLEIKLLILYPRYPDLQHSMCKSLKFVQVYLQDNLTRFSRPANEFTEYQRQSARPQIFLLSGADHAPQIRFKTPLRQSWRQFNTSLTVLHYADS